jgi:hypothetical protein
MISLRNLEIHVTHSCNLACQQCSHYSNFKHQGMLTPDDVEREFVPWSSRLRPRLFSLLGGEPALNPDLPEIVRLAGRHWPDSQLQLVTNGFLLPRHPDLPPALTATGCRLEISVHHDSPEYQSRLDPVRDLIRGWEREHPIQVNWRESSSRWRRTYRGDGRSMLPYTDGNPRQSWSVCRSKWCPQIFDGRLWKCPQLAYLRMQLAKVGRMDIADWQPYLAYQPLSPDCTDEQLREFVAREDESCCSMCPAGPEIFSLDIPLR